MLELPRQSRQGGEGGGRGDGGRKEADEREKGGRTGRSEGGRREGRVCYRAVQLEDGSWQLNGTKVGWVWSMQCAVIDDGCALCGV